MPDYRRAFVPGGTFFFTVVTERRAPILCADRARELLRSCITDCRNTHPFEIEAFVLLPDHLHPILRLPDGDGDFSTRLSIIKRKFSQRWVDGGGKEQTVSNSRRKNRRLGVWQRRFWEHVIRDEDDRINHLDYVHYNPVKHGLVTCPHFWPYSSFHRYVQTGFYDSDWMCVCGGNQIDPPKFAGLRTDEME